MFTISIDRKLTKMKKQLYYPMKSILVLFHLNQSSVSVHYTRTNFNLALLRVSSGPVKSNNIVLFVRSLRIAVQ